MFHGALFITTWWKADSCGLYNTYLPNRDGWQGPRESVTVLHTYTRVIGQYRTALPLSAIYNEIRIFISLALHSSSFYYFSEIGVRIQWSERAVWTTVVFSWLSYTFWWRAQLSFIVTPLSFLDLHLSGHDFHGRLILNKTTAMHSYNFYLSYIF